ncbi:MAG: ATP-binding cassette domain-containing protein [Candidatus Micrarchaeota archaeon]
MVAIKVEKLTKKFNQFTAVNEISFSVEEGEIFGLLGPNGAGKTTTINMLSTLLDITAGYAEVGGFEVSKNRDGVRRSIGIVFQDPALDNKLTGRENLEFHARMYNLSDDVRETRIKEVLELVELTEKADALVETYSGGMKRRLEIARGLVHRPKVLFLDEPTLGLDAQTRRHIWDYVSKLNREIGITIILTTHYMEEADYLCKRIAIIDHGKIAALDTPSRLKDSLGGDVVSIEVEGDASAFSTKLEKETWVKKVAKHGEECSGNKLCLTMERAEQRIAEIVELARASGVKITSVSTHKPSLEDVFLQLTGKTMREEEASGASPLAEMMRRRARGN